MGGISFAYGRYLFLFVISLIFVDIILFAPIDRNSLSHFFLVTKEQIAKLFVGEKRKKNWQKERCSSRGYNKVISLCV